MRGFGIGWAAFDKVVNKRFDPYALCDADRPDVRIGVGLRNATGLFLKRTLKHAQLVGTQGVGAIELLRSGKVDIAVGSP